MGRASTSEPGYRVADPRVSLVTGFPGFSSRELVRRLLGRGSQPVWAVMREADGASADEFRASLTADQSERLTLLEGDPSAIDMGLSGSEYRRVAERVRCIFHFSHTVAAGRARDRSEADNVGGMREALELARAAADLSTLVVHSSLAVSGDRVGHVTESDLVMQQRFVDPVEETLARAELMARRCMGRLPIVVLRSGQVVGDRETGRVDVLDGVYLLILLILSSPQDLSPVLPRWGDAPIHAFPVDDLARTAIAASEHRGVHGSTLHLTDERPMTIRMAFNRCTRIRTKLMEEGFTMPPLSRLLGRRGVIRGRLQSLLWRPRAFINSSFRDVRYDTAGARQFHAEVGLSPVPLEAYFERLVRHVADTVSTTRAGERP